MASQTTSDLRAIVIRRVGSGHRVALLSSDQGVVKGLKANRCEVLIDPASLEELRAFDPRVVVAFDGLALQGGEEAFRAVARVAPAAELVFSFANASAASSLLSGLVGGSPGPTLSEPEVRRWLTSAGYVVTSKDIVVGTAKPTGLSADTEAALRQMLEQVNPSAAVERYLLVARRGAEASRPDRAEGVVSVIVTGNDESALTGTIASLANQQQRPLELVVVSPLAADRLEAAVGKARLRAGVTVVTRSAAGGSLEAQLNEGLALTTGQYLAFASAPELFSPLHLSTLRERLETGTNAWIVGAAGAPGPFSIAEALRSGRVHRSQWILDRDRLGPFPITFAEGVESPDALLFTRLALLFRPAHEPRSQPVEGASPPPFDLDRFLASLRGRPLRGVVSLDELMSPPPSLGALVEERIAADPRAKAALERAKGLVARVSQAWDQAKKDRG